MQINKFHGLGAVSADDYINFAREAWFLSRCDIEKTDRNGDPNFNDPLPGQDRGSWG